ncbi:MAG: peptidoglycan DD-metalloendopeptidase family protein, partial [Porphyrobacter sp.]|nr:peptidoglycan DD-metalloendopeptidase family protein [Porphyrobacter sp.]
WVKPESASPAPGAPADGAGEAETTSFNPRTWVQAGAGDSPPPSDDVPQASIEPGVASASRRKLALWAGGGAAGVAALVAASLLVPSGKPAAEASEAIVKTAATPAAPRYETMIFQAADLAELGANLSGMGIAAGDADIAAREVVAALGTIEPMTVTVELKAATGGVKAIHSLTAELANGAAVRLVREKNGSFTQQAVVETAQVRICEVSGTYNDNTFYDSAVDAGMPNGLVSDFTQAFSFDVDWAQIRIGDKFKAIWQERVTAAGREVEPPRLIAVEFETGGVRRSFFAYTPSTESTPRWFDETGKGNARSLMRTPVDGARITSKFGPRFHPIYKTPKNHNGVDFAAPIGTAIYAAGKGEVIFAAMAGGAGNLVKIAHGEGLETRYMHLDAFAPDVGPGTPVTQGQLIGYVGTTGGSTGPHLHFEIRVDEAYVDPLSFANTVTEVLAGEEQRWYLAERKARLTEVSQSKTACQPAGGNGVITAR